MAKKKKAIPEYGTVIMGGTEYFRTRINDADGKRVALYAKTPEELYEKVEEAKKHPIVFDEDCEELSPAMQKAFRSAVVNRNRRNGRRQA